MPATDTPSLALAAGIRLEEFEVLSVIGAGGFGIVYQAFDHSLERRIALKEYMPSQYAYRSDGVTIKPRGSRDIETFEVGLRSFVNEARMLARFDHRALVKVYRFWEANGTAYMAMPLYEGLTLKQTLERGAGVPPEETWLRSLLYPLLEACATLHAAHCFHRDIAPDNIILTSGGPVLLDFGAARRVIGDATRTLTVILKEGYAPIEQYGGSAVLVQGPWTDIYALCGVLRYAITGHAPPPSVERLIADRMEPLSALNPGNYSDAFLRGIDAGLALQPKDRPQDVAELRRMIDASPDAATVLRVPEQMPDPTTRDSPNDSAPPPHREAVRSRVWIGGASLLVLLLWLAAYFLRNPVGHSSAHGDVPARVDPGAASAVSGAASTASPAPPLSSPAPPTASTPDSADQREALAEQQSTDALISRARTTVAENGGSADSVLADAIASQSAGASALASGDALGASSHFREATLHARRAVHGFLEDLVSSYSSIAKRKMKAGDLELSQRAIEKVKALRQTEADFK